MAVWVARVALCACLVSWAAARRIQVTDALYPYLGTEAGGVVRWSAGEMLEALYFADWVEIAPRGIRLGRAPPPSHPATGVRDATKELSSGGGEGDDHGDRHLLPIMGVCRATVDALCVWPEGLMLPSPPVGDAVGAETRMVVRGGACTARVPFPVMDRVAVRRMQHLLPARTNNGGGAEEEEEEDGEEIKRKGVRGPLLAYAEQEACRAHSKGRRLIEWNRTAALPAAADAAWPQLTHTVTACDVVEGHWVALHTLTSDRMRLVAQTFGPTAYFAVLVQAVGCLYCATNAAVVMGRRCCSATTTTTTATTANDQVARRSAVAATCLLLSCVGRDALRPIPFVVSVDRLHFALTCLACGLLAACAASTGRTGQGGEACVYALMALADAVYRSPENPYAGIVCVVLIVRQWHKALEWGGVMAMLMMLETTTTTTTTTSAPTTTTFSWRLLGDALDLWLGTLVLCLTAELGVATQCLYAERWPFYAGAAVYIGFAVAHLRSSIESSRCD